MLNPGFREVMKGLQCNLDKCHKILYSLNFKFPSGYSCKRAHGRGCCFDVHWLRPEKCFPSHMIKIAMVCLHSPRVVGKHMKQKLRQLSFGSADSCGPFSCPIAHLSKQVPRPSLERQEVMTELGKPRPHKHLLLCNFGSFWKLDHQL